VVLWLAVALTVVSGLDIVAHGMREPKPIESDAKSPGIEA
jgi:hypothetical protein